MKKLTIYILFLGFSIPGFSQFLKGKEGITKYQGYFNFYYDETSDKLSLEVNKLNTEFLYVHSLSEGLGSNDIGLDRGQLGDGVVVKFTKAGNKLLLIQPNQNYRAVTRNEEERKSVEEAFAKSVLYGFIIKETYNGVYLVDATDFFMKDAHGVANRLLQSQQGNYQLDKTKSAIHLERTKAFPKNVEFDVMLTFKGNPKGNEVASVAPNASLVTVHQHHSFVELPDNGYTPRKYDPRCGSWQMTYMDYATPVNEPIQKRFIYRHRLEKKNPEATLSEAKEPIVYYLDRGTPEPIRSALLEGGSWWNQAFEAAGYKNAFQVAMLPEGADPLDVRYNMIQWVHRSTRGWSYGGSISDPRTGEIIKGHVSLGSLRIRQDFLIAQALQAPYTNNATTNETVALEMALARIRQLSAHEIGHTLGFAHNFAASTHNRASVMDYPHPKLTIKNNKIDFTQAYDTQIGEWDIITVAYAYQDFPKHKKEEKELNQILENAFAKGLRFITDEDARPKGSAHAYAHLWDNGENIVEELENILRIRKLAIQNFSIDNIKYNEPYSVLEDVFVPLYFFHRYQTEAVSKLIGGLDYTYAVKGQKELVVKNIEGTIERKALQVLLKTLDVHEIAIPKNKLGLFPPRAYGYDRTRESFKSKVGVAFDYFGAVETATEFTLDFLLHPERINRLILYKSVDKNQLGAEELFKELIKTTFDKKYEDGYLQGLHEIVKKETLEAIFLLASDDSIYPQAKAIVDKTINEIALKAAKKPTTTDMLYVKMITDYKKNPKDFKREKAPKIPDGSPIGTLN